MHLVGLSEIAAEPLEQVFVTEELRSELDCDRTKALTS